MPQVIDSVGVEYEVEDFNPNNIPRELRGFWEVTHDASCEKDAEQLSSGLILNRKNEFLTYRKIVLGGELVSQVIDTSDESYIIPIKDLCSFVIESGESPQSYRAGIHIHVCFSNPNLRMLKSCIRLWRYLEDLFYLVGGMGYEFRGVRNDATYCRPLTKNGPIVVPKGENFVESLNVNDLLDSRTVSQFWSRWGDLPNQGEERYFPVRYHGFNLSPAYKRGTIEFRIFNKCVNPLYIKAIINLCKSFAEFSLFSSIDDFTRLAMQENSVYDRRSKDEIANTFLEYSKIVKLDSFTVEEIMHIIERTPPVTLSSDRIISHLKNVKQHWPFDDYNPRIIKDFIKPHYEDLHVLRGER